MGATAWSETSDRILRQMWRDGHTREEIARVVGRSVAGVRDRIRRLELPTHRERVGLDAPEQEPGMHDILRAVEEATGITVKRLKSPQRGRAIAHARFLAYWAGRKSRHTMGAIGLAIGGRDHSTIMHGISVVDRMPEKQAVAAAVYVAAKRIRKRRYEEARREEAERAKRQLAAEQKIIKANRFIPAVRAVPKDRRTPQHAAGYAAYAHRW